MTLESNEYMHIEMKVAGVSYNIIVKKKAALF